MTDAIPDEVLLPRYTNAESRFVNLGEQRIHYRDEGKRDGRTILLLHGSQASLHTWEPWVELLSMDFRLVTADLPGHGFSSPIADGNYSLEPMTRLIGDLARKLALPQFTLVGSGLGALLSISFAARHQQDLAGLVLVACAGYDCDDPQLFSRTSSQSEARKELEQCYHNPSFVTDQLFNRYYELSLRAGNSDAQSSLQKHTAQYNLPRALRDDLKNLKLHSLIMWGQNDRWLPTSVAEQFHQDLPLSTLRIYPRAGHLPMEEQAEMTAAGLKSFMLGTL